MAHLSAMEKIRWLLKTPIILQNGRLIIEPLLPVIDVCINIPISVTFNESMGKQNTIVHFTG